MTEFSWSYSAYSSAVSCLRKFKYCYIDKLVVEGPESSDLIFGSALHSAINACLTGSNGATTFEIYWGSYKGKEVQYGRFNWEHLEELGKQFMRKFEKYHAGKYKLEFAEKRLYAEYKGIKLEGTLDYYGEYNGKKSIRDFKTSSRNYEEAKSDCAIQLYLYSYLWLQNNPGSIIETLGYTVFNKVTGSIQDLPWEFNESKMYEALDNMIQYLWVWDLKGGADSYPKNYNACLDYNRKCPYWDNCHKENKQDG